MVTVMTPEDHKFYLSKFRKIAFVYMNMVDIMLRMTDTIFVFTFFNYVKIGLFTDNQVYYASLFVLFILRKVKMQFKRTSKKDLCILWRSYYDWSNMSNVVFIQRWWFCVYCGIFFCIFLKIGSGLYKITW